MWHLLIIVSYSLLLLCVFRTDLKIAECLAYNFLKNSSAAKLHMMKQGFIRTFSVIEQHHRQSKNMLRVSVDPLTSIYKWWSLNGCCSF